MPLLTVVELRRLVDQPTGEGTDQALQMMLDAAESAITSRYGPIGTVTEFRRGGGRYISTTRPYAEIAKVTSWEGNVGTLMDATDWRPLADGHSIERLLYGTTPASYWTPTVEVEYTPIDDRKERCRVQAALIALELNHHPGLVAQQIGDWSETYASRTLVNYEVEREGILASLAGSPMWDFA